MLVGTERKPSRSDARRTPPSASEHILCELEHGLHWGSCKTVQGSTLRARDVLVAPPTCPSVVVGNLGERGGVWAAGKQFPALLPFWPLPPANTDKSQLSPTAARPTQPRPHAPGVLILSSTMTTTDAAHQHSANGAQSASSRSSVSGNANINPSQALFQCGDCKRSYTRVDHLARHVRSRKSHLACIT
jgi:hypothetical protein